jgi:hypothetical protein
MYINLAPHLTVAKSAGARRLAGRIFLPFMSLYPVVPVVYFYFSIIYLCFWIFILFCQLWELRSQFLWMSRLFEGGGE